jgi:hypothetical protein
MRYDTQADCSDNRDSARWRLGLLDFQGVAAQEAGL